MRLSRLILLVPVAFIPVLVAAPETPKSDYNPKVAKASDEGEKAIPRFKIDKSLKVEVWAAEPLLANPVAFTFDEKGVCYVAETFRLHKGVTDTRGHMYWLDDDLASRTVADRVAKYWKHHGRRFKETYERERDRVRRVEDSDGDGKADRATVFSDDFGRAEDGLGSGVLARKGNIYYTCIPDLWLLKDTKKTGTADVKQSLATGFGVHTGFIGHDLHGLVIGPDGRLYFSIGDRGLNVKTKEGKHLYCPDSGAVLRCELDGSNLEIFATGLRNPQELAFDDFGNLFTVDNNSDAGDQARLFHIVQGGDYGWRMGYQYESSMHDETVGMGNRGPWNYERLWRPDTQAAYIVPAIKNFSNGPSGFTAYPGVGLSDRYKGHFFLANFSGGPNNSGIFSFATKPKGASFEMVDDHKFVWDILATDCEFGPDGAFYISDWVNGWGLPGKGRIYKVSDPEAMKDSAITEAKKLLAEGMEGKSVEELIKLLGHAHRGVRMEAQLALVAKGPQVIPAIVQFESKSTDRIPRLHAIWALSTIRRIGKSGDDQDVARRRLMELLRDSDAEVRGNAAQFGRLSYRELVPLLKDPESRVRMMAAQGIVSDTSREIDSNPAVRADDICPAVIQMLRDNDGRDPSLRHAGAEVLARAGDRAHVLQAVNDQSSAVRLAVVVALRKSIVDHFVRFRWRSDSEIDAASRKLTGDLIALYLSDSDPKVVAEAARALNDEALTASLPKLAALMTKPNLERVTAYRVLNANYLVGKPENAHALAQYAARSDVPTPLRALAVKMLGSWVKPPRRDYITGLTQSLPERPSEDARAAFSIVIGKLFAGPNSVRRETTSAATKLGIKEVGPFLVTLVGDAKAEPNTRVEALNALAALNDAKLVDAAKTAVTADDPIVRTAGRSVLIKKDPAGTMKALRTVLAGSNIAEQQGTFTLLTANPSAESDALIEEWLDRLIAKTSPPELSLEILEAAASSKSERIKRRLAGFEEARSKDDIGKYRETLAGGNPIRGKEIFLSNAAVQCQRCHQLDGQGGEVGPPANGAGKQTREYLLEAIVLPSKAIAKGYDTILITTLDNKSVSGVLKGEDHKEVRLMTAEGKLVIVKKSDIDDRRTTKSAMPDDLVGKLNKRELRDLIEFLSRLKEEWKK